MDNMFPIFSEEVVAGSMLLLQNVLVKHSHNLEVLVDRLSMQESVLVVILESKSVIAQALTLSMENLF
jgi:hypothetical protein